MYYPRVEISYTLWRQCHPVHGDGIKHPNERLDGQDINHPWLPDNGMGPSTMKAIKMAEWNVG